MTLLLKPFFVILLVLTFVHAFGQGGPELKQIQRKPAFSAQAHLIDSFLQRADSFKRADLPDVASSLAQMLIVSSRQIGYHAGVVKALSVKGTSLLLLEDYKHALESFDEAIAITKEAHLDKLGEAAMYSFKGIAYFFLTHYDSAALSAYKAIDILTENNLKSSTVYANLSTFWLNMNDEKNALYYQHETEKMAVALKDTSLLIKAYLIHGFIYLELNKNTDSAIYYFQNVLDLSRPRKDGSVVDALHGIGSIYFKRKEYAKAISYYQSALPMSKSIDASGTDISILYKLGMCYLNLKDHVTAKRMLMKGLELAHLFNNKSNTLPDIYRALSELYNATRAYDSAYKYLKLSIDNDRELPSKETEKIINELEIKYQSAEKDKVLAQRQSKIKEQKAEIKEKNFWFALLSAGFLLIIALSVFIYINSKHRHKIQEAMIANILQQQQINQLKARMDGENEERKRIAQELHDGVCNMISAASMHLDNSLEKDKELRREDEHTKGLKLLNAAYEELRRTSHNLYPEQLLKHGLVKALHYYCKIISRPPELNVYYQVLGEPQAIAPEKALSIYRIIQESLHNAIRHGKATEIIVQTEFEQSGEIAITIEDNGKGLADDKKTSPHIGIGMYSLEQRADALGGNMQLSSQEGVGTTISITFDHIDT